MRWAAFLFVRYCNLDLVLIVINQNCWIILNSNIFLVISIFIVIYLYHTILIENYWYGGGFLRIFWKRLQTEFTFMAPDSTSTMPEDGRGVKPVKFKNASRKFKIPQNEAKTPNLIISHLLNYIILNKFVFFTVVKFSSTSPPFVPP